LKLLQTSVSLLLRRFHLKRGVLVDDDTDHRRAKKPLRIYGAYKIFDKKTGGYFNGQCVMFLLLVTDLITLPVGGCFYRPDPRQQAWKKEKARLIKAGVKTADRPKPPHADPDYPDKVSLALSLIDTFCQSHPDFTVQAVLADAAFGHQAFMDAACARAGCRQTISQLHADQLVLFRNRERPVQDYFARHQGTLQTLALRGGESVQLWINSARLKVKAHGTKRFVMAVKRVDEAQYRYWVATDLSWRTLDLVGCYTFRWRVEVFLEDWKLYEGWAGLAKQPDEDGSVRGLILSLLLDHALLIHPEQRARLENRGPACTVGSLKQAACAEAIMQFVRKILAAAEPARMLDELAEKLRTLFPLAPSGKHMSGRDLGRLEPSASLRYRAAAP